MYIPIDRLPQIRLAVNWATLACRVLDALGVSDERVREFFVVGVCAAVPHLPHGEFSELPVDSTYHTLVFLRARCDARDAVICEDGSTVRYEAFLSAYREAASAEIRRILTEEKDRLAEFAAERRWA